MRHEERATTDRRRRPRYAKMRSGVFASRDGHIQAVHESMDTLYARESAFADA